MGGSTLLIVVVNGPTGEAATEADREVAAAATRCAPLGPASSGWLPRRGSVDVMWVERCGDAGIPAREGVGRARKIGGDLALRAWRDGLVSDPWIHFTDADARPSTALQDMTAWSRATAVVWPFVHGTHEDPDVARGHWQHEIWMRWWVRGLEYAGSPFAYHTIGSCISVGARAYADVRGVPARPAGEDFHLLNKLAKLGGVARPHVAPVEIEARRSSRVPFGTGPAVARLANDRSTWTLTRPEVFQDLRRWLAVLSDFVHDRPEPWRAAGDRRAILERALGEVCGTTWEARLGALGAPSQRSLRAMQWFDGLKTLRLVHALERGRGDSPAPAMEVLASISTEGDTPLAREAAICALLRREEASWTPWVGHH